MKNFYDILVTDVNCSAIEIKEAYEKLSVKFRPDLNQNDPYFENRFKQICEAYEVLGDPAKRRQYDQQLREIKAYSLIKTKKEQRYYNKAIDITFTIVLVFFTLVFGDYVISSIRSKKAAKVKKAVAVNAVPSHKTKHHKKKYVAKIITAHPFFKVKPDTAKTNPVVQTPVNDNVIVNIQKAETPKTSNPENNVTNDLKRTTITENNPDFPYATYLFSNETGVVNMRKFDSYGSAIIKVIPTKSEVFVLEKGNTYYKVQFDNSIGYVPKWSVQTK